MYDHPYTTHAGAHKGWTDYLFTIGDTDYRLLTIEDNGQEGWAHKPARSSIIIESGKDPIGDHQSLHWPCILPPEAAIHLIKYVWPHAFAAGKHEGDHLAKKAIRHALGIKDDS